MSVARDKTASGPAPSLTRKEEVAMSTKQKAALGIFGAVLVGLGTVLIHVSRL